MRAHWASRATASGAQGAAGAAPREAGRGRFGRRSSGRVVDREAGPGHLGGDPRRMVPHRVARGGLAARPQRDGSGDGRAPTTATSGSAAAETKDDLFALFGEQAGEARALYDPAGNAAARRTQAAGSGRPDPGRAVAPSRQRDGARSACRYGGTDSPMWPSRCATNGRARRMASKSPTPSTSRRRMVGDKVTDADKAMGALASAYWVAFRQDRRPERRRSAGMAAP